MIEKGGGYYEFSTNYNQPLIITSDCDGIVFKIQSSEAKLSYADVQALIYQIKLLELKNKEAYF